MAQLQSSAVTGSLVVTGTITAQEFNTEFISSSILHESGSTSFGNSSDDVHNMTGSLIVNRTPAASQGNVMIIENKADLGSSQDLVIRNTFDRDIGIKFEEGGGTYYQWMDGNGDDSMIFSAANTGSGDITMELFQNHNVGIPNGNLTVGGTVTATSFSGTVSLNFADLGAKTSGTGNYSTTDNLIAGRGSGGPALTVNDGYGNANVTFNHTDGTPEQNGNSGRIEVNTDSTSSPTMDFELKANVTSGVAVQTDSILRLSDSGIIAYKELYIPQYIYHDGNTNTRIRFQANDINMQTNAENVFRINGNDTQKEIVINEVGADYDFRVEGDANTNLIFANAGNDQVGIGTGTTEYRLNIHSGTTNVTSKFVSSDNQAWISVQDDDSGTYGALFGTDSDAGHDIVLAQSSAFKRLVISSTGNVGIWPSATTSTQAPATNAALHVSGSNDVLLVEGSGSTILDVQGSQGQLFSVTDDLTNTLFAASDISGVPVFLVSGSGESYFDGNLGIGTSNPAKPLHIQTNDAAYGSMRIYRDSTSQGEVSIGFFGKSNSSTNEAWVIGEGGWSNTNDFVIGNENSGAGGNVRLLIERGGNVGIGTTTPAGKFNSYISATRQLTHNGNGGDFSILSDNNSSPVFYVKGTGTADLVNVFDNTTEVFTIKDGGNVGIGATDPLRTLHVVGNMAVNAGTGEYYGILMQGGESANPSILIGDWHNSSGTIKWDSSGNYLRIDSQHSTANAAIIFSGNDATTEYMRIASTGKVGIATSSPSAELHVNGQVLIGTDGGDETDTPPASFADLHIHTLASGQPIAQDDAASIVISTGANSTGAQGWNGTLWFGNSDYPAAGDLNNATGDQFNYQLAGIGSYSEDDTGASNTGTGDLRFFTTNQGSSPSTRMVIGNDGNVGIGTTSPDDKLHIVGNLFIEDSSPEITLETGASHYNWQIAAQENVDTALEFSVGSQDGDASNDTFTPKMVILQNGRVGIGTTIPSQLLHVEGASLLNGQVDVNDNNIIDAKSLRFTNQEGSTFGTVSGTLMFDENFYSDTEYGSTSIWNGNGGGLAIYNEDGWGRMITDANMEFLNAKFNSSTIETNPTDHSSTNWYSITDSHNLVRVKDSNELYMEKETSGAAYAYFTLHPEQVGENFDLSFRLSMGTPGTGYRHLAIAIGSDGTNTTTNYDYLVFRHRVDNTGLNQIRLDVAGTTEGSTVSSDVPNFADGTERHVFITVRNNQYIIEVDGVVEHTITASARTSTSGQIGFSIYEAADANTHITVRDFKITHYGNDRNMLAPNVGIGTTNPGGALHVYNGTSERFLIDGDVKVAGSTDLYITGASRRIVFSNGNGTIRTSTANNLVFETNGANERLTIKSNGNIAVGGTDFVDINRRSIYLDSFDSGGGAGIFFRDGYTYNCSITAEDHNGSSADGICISGYDGVSISTGANTRNERMRITTGGSVGIGTTSPGFRLQVATPEEATDPISFAFDISRENSSSRGMTFGMSSDDAYGAIGTHNADFRFGHTFGTEANGQPAFYPTMTIQHVDQDKGNVGVGTTTPDAPLSVIGRTGLGIGASGIRVHRPDSFGQFGFLDYGQSSGTTYIGSSYTGGTAANYGVIAFRQLSNGGAVKDTMVISDSNKVGIGISSPDGLLHVYKAGTSGTQEIMAVLGSTSLRPVLQFSESTSGAINSGMSLEYNGVGSGDTNYMTFNAVNGDPRHKFYSGGNSDFGGPSHYYGTLNANNGTTSLVLRNYDSTLVDAGDIQGRIQFTGRYWSSSTSQLVESRIEHGHQLSDGNGGSFLRFLTQVGGDSPVEQMRIDREGFVGIGITSPSEKLVVGGNAIIGGQSVTSTTTNHETVLRIQGKNNYSDGTTWYGTYGQIILHSDSNMTASARRFMITNALANNKFAIVRSVDANTDPVVNSTAGGNSVSSGTADFVIDNSGNVGIGTHSPGNTLDVNGATDINGQLVVQHGTTTTAYIARFVGDSDGLQIKNIGTGDYQIGNTQQDNAINFYDGTGGVEIEYNGSKRLEADSAGGVAVTGTLSATADVVAYSSDERLKENIKEIENPIDKIKQIKGVTFDWKDKVDELGFEPSTKKNDIGVIAQDIEKVLPQLIVPAPFDKALDEEGNRISKSGEDYKTVQYNRLSALLIEGIKEQQKQIEALKARIDELENK